jgi:hypothetical protein
MYGISNVVAEKASAASCHRSRGGQRMIEHKRMKFVRAADFMKDLTSLPEEPGVYLMFFNGGRKFLEQSGYFEYERAEPMSVGGREHLYTGSTGVLRRRLQHHLLGRSRVSSLRKTLLAAEVMLASLSCTGTEACEVGVSEIRLTNWLMANTTVGYILSDRPLELEQRILRTTPSPLNIKERKSKPYARWLCFMRDDVFNDDPYGEERH